MKVTLRHLEVFVTVSKYGNVSRAAKDLLLSQSAVSMALSEFEKQMGEKLFDRVSKRLVINDSGRAILPKCIDIITRINELELSYLGKGHKITGHLKVGASSTIANYLVPELICKYNQTYPDVSLLLDAGNTEYIINQLLLFQLDIGFVEAACQLKEIETIPWKTDQLSIFVNAKHPLAKKAIVTLDDLQEQKWILREIGSGTRSVFEKAISKQVIDIDIHLEMAQTEAIKTAVKHSNCISCLSKLTIKEDLEAGRLVEINTPFLDLNRYFYILLHKEKYQTEALNLFKSLCVKEQNIF